MPNITIKNWPEAIQAGNETVLEAALANGIPYPHNCHRGECGACKTRLLQGTVTHASYYDEALSKEEKNQGFILACRARPESDIELLCVGEFDAVAPYPVRCAKATVVAVEQAGHGVYRIKLCPGKQALKFAAGQYLQLQFGKLAARSFSMANQPNEEILEFHIQQLPCGLVTNYIAQHLKIGDKVHIEGPFGSSFLREQHGGPILAVAEGTGLAPILSIVRTALTKRLPRAIYLYASVHDKEDPYAATELKALAAQYNSLPIQTSLHIKTIVSAGRQSECRTGSIHRAIGCDFLDLTGFQVYIAGPPLMVDAVKQTVLSCNAHANDIYINPFTASGKQQAQTHNREHAGVLQSKIAKLFGRRSPPVPAQAQYITEEG